MNVYDFDGTICRDDTERDFFKYMFFHRPINFIYTFYFLNAYIKRKRNKISEAEFYNRIYLVIKGVKDIKKVVNKFWSKRKKKLLPWYFKQQREDDVIVTGTPDFLVEDIFKEINIKHYIASSFDVKNHKYVGDINVEEIKPINFLKQYRKEDIDNFYTDSMRDLPMIKLAKKAFIIDKNYQIKPYIG